MVAYRVSAGVFVMWGWSEWIGTDGKARSFYPHFRLASRGRQLLDLPKLNGIDHFVVRQRIGDYDKPGAFSAPLAAFQIGQRIENCRFRVGAEWHEKRFHAPGEQQLPEQCFIVGESVYWHRHSPEGRQR